MSFVVTGGAGFIGSCIVRMLNDMGIDDIIIVDNINVSDKWLNLRNKRYRQYIHKNDFLEELLRLNDITHIIHMGACSATTEQDFDYLYQNNYLFSCTLWRYCTEKQISFMYASSAATYGDGSSGFDDKTDIENYLPLNKYGYSKQIFDLWVEKQKEKPKQFAGFKFFNVYGPNEYFKGNMASVIFHGFKQVKKTGKIQLFKSYKKEYLDGGQLRDFVYVKDICKVIKFFIENKSLNGIYNIGTGQAESFNVLGKAVFSAMEMTPNIEYIDMPESLREKYQYFTQADIKKLRKAGFKEEFYDLKTGVMEYVEEYLNYEFQVY